MERIIEPQTGQTWIRLNPDEIKLGFLVQCVEATAALAGCDYLAMLRRMENVNLTEGYILKFYDTLHTESFENVIQGLLNQLLVREASIPTA